MAGAPAPVCASWRKHVCSGIETALPGDARTAAALLGVTEPTLLRRKAQQPRHF